MENPVTWFLFLIWCSYFEISMEFIFELRLLFYTYIRGKYSPTSFPSSRCQVCFFSPVASAVHDAYLIAFLFADTFTHAFWSEHDDVRSYCNICVFNIHVNIKFALRFFVLKRIRRHFFSILRQPHLTTYFYCNSQIHNLYVWTATISITTQISYEQCLSEILTEMLVANNYWVVQQNVNRSVNAERIKAKSHWTNLHHQPTRYHQANPIAIIIWVIDRINKVLSTLLQEAVINSTITVTVLIFNFIDQAQVA